jgi:hypothetical protein
VPMTLRYRHAPSLRTRSRRYSRQSRPAGWPSRALRSGRSDAPDLLPSSLSIADAGALTELRVLAREERDDWLEQQRAFMSGYRRGQRRG